MSFTWIPYYKEFAQRLTQFQKDRKRLLNLIYNNRDELLAKYLHDQGGEGDLLEDIDPFTVFGLFNRGIKHENRINSAKLFKNILDIKADIPKDFEGIPVLNNQKSHFFGFRSHRGKNDIQNLWNLFIKVVNDENFEEEYNTVIKQFIIKVNITMGLFWIRPEKFLAFDRTNRQYLKEQYGIKLPNKAPEYSEYMKILDSINKKMASGEIKENTFYELSANANNLGYDNSDYDSYLEWGSFYTELWKKRKNIILQGAPGTGKTYRIPELVVRLCEPEFDANNATRKELMSVYNRLKEEKRVMFTTFHQSMDYEDWLEGLRPVLENDQVTYKIEPGIFKRLCTEAERPLSAKKDVNISDEAIVWKVSLSGTGDNPVRRDCMKNGYIRIGWDGYGENITEETDWSIHNGEGKTILNTFINTMKVGDVVMSCYSSRTIDAIGIVTGEYEWHDNFEHYKRVRRVKWLVKDINEDIVKLNDDKTMTLGTVYRLNAITLDKVKSLLDKYEASKTLIDNNKPYVIVIDEFNRGNVSKIFGELITLLEPDKRKGMRNAESVLLPYSKKEFYIPSNVFLVATMNTADRSLDTIDYAIRRRFAFITVKPQEIDDDNFNSELFREVSSLFISNYDEYAESGFDDTIKLLPAETLSEEYRPEDVWIGHSYFIMDGEYALQDRLLFEIIPLLEEYIRDGVLTSEAQQTIDKLYLTATEQ
ncbi:AAA family ATPase [Phocaeicola salanitronis]|uniref:AAA family ATPase n=1 Tax=Phocaeicola salanitronis TaxID=376805 RepID=UPI0025A36CF5|nr:AAA family ATPase [Phocaeicola salanitronis]MDM8307532.1 AAA family ATPase [Phocaeicola salanitronis]